METATNEEKLVQVTIKVYTAGSCIEGGVGATAVLYRNGQEKRTLRKYLGMEDQHTVYEAELVGMCMGAKLVCEEVRATMVMLGVNSQATIQATHNTKGNPRHYLVDALHDQTEAAQMHHKQLDLEARWVPGHKGTKGNERADEEAKKAAKGNSSPDTSLPTQCRGHLPLSKAATHQAFNKNLKAEAAATFAKSPRYQRMREIDPSILSLQFMKIVSLLTWRAASLLIQLRTGHVPLNKHLH
jgi:ribonuclease HI